MWLSLFFSMTSKAVMIYFQNVVVICFRNMAWTEGFRCKGLFLKSCIAGIPDECFCMWRFCLGRRASAVKIESERIACGDI